MQGTFLYLKNWQNGTILKNSNKNLSIENLSKKSKKKMQQLL